MAKAKRRRKGGRRKGGSKTRPHPSQEVCTGNYVAGSMPGCHVAHGCSGESKERSWIIGFEPFDREEFGLGPDASVPDLSIDPEDGLLTLINASSQTARAYYISVDGHRVLAANKRELRPGKYRDSNGAVRQCTTLIVTVGPSTAVDVCHIELPQAGPQAVRLSSDISDLVSLPRAPRGPSTGMPATPSGDRSLLGFPLGGSGPYRCSQGVSGRFTHFYPATRHAIDIECPVGTPILAVAKGRVTDVQDGNVAGGIHVSLLYKWNSVSLELQDGSLVDYVHIHTGSARVKCGDVVEPGHILCLSGDVGFCPTPHLHIQITANSDKDAPTVPFAFRAASTANTAAAQDRKVKARNFLPVAGLWYSASGPCAADECPGEQLWRLNMAVHAALVDALPHSAREIVAQYLGV